MRALLTVLTVAVLLRATPAAAADIPADLDIEFDNLVVSKAELVCLALNDYWESRGEPLEGRIAVAQVVLNRAMDRKYPTNLCDVVKQNVYGGLHKCQFSWHCDGRSDHPHEEQAWRESLLLATAVLSRHSAIVDPTGGAKWYHAASVKPAWSRHLRKVRRINGHVFYREPDRDDPDWQPYNFADWVKDRTRYTQIAQAQLPFGFDTE